MYEVGELVQTGTAVSVPPINGMLVMVPVLQTGTAAIAGVLEGSTVKPVATSARQM